MKRAAASLVFLGAFLQAPAPVSAERLLSVTVKMHNHSDQTLALTLHDEHDGRSIVIRVPPQGKASFALQSSQESDNCCGSVSFSTTEGGAIQRRGNLKNGDVIDVP